MAELFNFLFFYVSTSQRVKELAARITWMVVDQKILAERSQRRLTFLRFKDES